MSDVLFEILLLSRRDDNVGDTDTNDPLPLSDRPWKAHVKLFWADGTFSRSSPLRLWLFSLLPPPPHTLFRASVTSLQDCDKSNAKDMKRSRSELATAVHWWAVRD